MQWTKSRIANWLLLSLIPTGLLGFVSFVAFALSTSNAPEPELWTEPWSTIWASGVILLWPYWWIALVTGVVLKVWEGRETRRLYGEGRQYAELHGWQQISDTAWKSFKRGNLVLSVSQAYGKTTYILAVDSDGDTAATDGFSRSLYALQFGDFLWENVLSGRSQVDVTVVQQTRAEWERFRALGPGR